MGILSPFDAILADDRTGNLELPLPQDKIQDLLTLCMGQYNADNPGVAEFWSKIRNLETSPS